MKNVLLKTKIFVMALGAVLVLSCSAEDDEDGAIGPQGPQGEQGPIGPQGPQGEQGPAGQDGANGEDGTDGQDGADGQDGNPIVISSDWIPIDWGSPDIGASIRIDDPLINQELTDSGLFYMYGKSGGTVVSIPLTFLNKSYIFALDAEFNSIFVNAYSIDGITLEDFNFISEVRYVIVPSTATGEMSTDSQEKNIDFNNYNEVIAYFDLEY
jgi:hypothetical protein